MKFLQLISFGLVLSFSFSQKSLATSALELCKKAAPTLDCESLSQVELKGLERICTDSSLTRSHWNGFGIGGKEELDQDGKFVFSIDLKKQGSANGRTLCEETHTYRHPRTEYDVVSAVQEALENNWKVKVVGAAHTDNELICGSGMAISSRFMNQIFGIETIGGVETVRIQPGVTLHQLGEWLHGWRKSLGFAIVGYEAVTVGGVIGTGAHGSAIRETSILSDIVESLRMVMADGSVREFTRQKVNQENPELWSALTLNLGMLGIVTEVSLRIQEDFQLNVVTTKMDDSGLFQDGQGVGAYVEGCDTASLHWFPQRGKEKGRIVRNCGTMHLRGEETWKEFEKHVDKGARYVLHAPEVNKFLYSIFQQMLHKGVCDPDILFKFEKTRRRMLPKDPPYARSRKLPIPFLKDRVAHPKGIRGWSFAMQNSVGSIEGNEYRQADWEVAIPIKKSPEVFRFLRELVNGRDPSLDKPIPFESVGLYMRFSKASETLLSHSAVGGDVNPGDTVMFLEISEFIPNFDVRNDAERKIAEAIMQEYERPYRTFIVELTKRFGGRVHWAKNRMEFFDLQEDQIDRRNQIKKFASHVKALDPNGLFGNTFSEMLFQKLDQEPGKISQETVSSGDM